MIIDATDLILGRMASFAAKQALGGENVQIVNCEKAVITGTKDRVFGRQKIRKEMGHHIKGPFYYHDPDFFVKRTIRGMVPHKLERGDAAMKRIRCYVGVPLALKEQKAQSVDFAHISHSKAQDYVKLGRILKLQGSEKV